MPTYRLYRLDGDGHISGADWIEAADDAAAIDDAQRQTDGMRFELWEGKRLIQRTKLVPAIKPRTT